MHQPDCSIGCGTGSGESITACRRKKLMCIVISPQPQRRWPVGCGVRRSGHGLAGTQSQGCIPLPSMALDSAHSLCGMTSTEVRGYQDMHGIKRFVFVHGKRYPEAIEGRKQLRRVVLVTPGDGAKRKQDMCRLSRRVQQAVARHHKEEGNNDESEGEHAHEQPVGSSVQEDLESRNQPGEQHL